MKNTPNILSLHKLLFIILALCGSGLVLAQNSGSVSITGDNNTPIPNGIVYLEMQTTKSGASYEYHLQRKLSGELEQWQQIASITTANSILYYNDSLYFCHDSVYYKVEVCEISSNGQTVNCVNSQELSINVEDKSYPEYREIDTISVLENPLRIALGWQPCTEKDVNGYIITREEGGYPMLLDSVLGAGNAFYEDFSAKPLEKQKYRIRVQDRCSNASINSIPKQIFTSSVQYEFCADSMRISFENPKYSVDKADRVVLQAKNVSTESYKTLQFKPYLADSIISFTWPANGKENYVFYKVVAQNTQNGYSSSSLYDSVEINIPKDPTYINLRNVSVQGEGVELHYSLDLANRFKYVKWLRSTIGDTSWREIKTLLENEAQEEGILEDIVKTSNEIYRYKGVLYNICDKEVLQTTVHNTICLKLRQNKENTLEWIWNTYQLWQDNGVLEGFELYGRERMSPGVSSVLAYIPASNAEEYTYTYTYSQPEEVFGIEFWIEAKRQENGITISSASNLISLNDGETAIFYMPSGFKPRGISAYYGPIGWFLEEDKIEWRVFNRQGKQIFLSRSKDQKWDGKYNGKYVEPGVYPYTVIVKRGQNTTKKTGTVTVVF